MEDFDIEPPEAPKGFSPVPLPAIDDPDIPLPLPHEGFLKKLFKKRQEKKGAVQEGKPEAKKEQPPGKDLPEKRDAFSSLFSDSEIPSPPDLEAPPAIDHAAALSGDAIVAPPQLDEFHAKQTEELDSLRKRLKEFTVPKEEKLESIDISLQEESSRWDAVEDEHPRLFGSLFKKKPAAEPAWIADELAKPREGQKFFVTNEKSGPTGEEEVEESERAARELQAIVDAPPGPAVQDNGKQDPGRPQEWTSEGIGLPTTPQTAILGMSGSIQRSPGKKPELVVQRITTPIDNFQEKERQLEETPELPPPRQTGARPARGMRKAAEMVKPLSPQEIEKIVQSLNKAEQDYASEKKTMDEYLPFLQQELHEIVKAPAAYEDVAQDKARIEERIRRLSRTRPQQPFMVKAKKAGSLADFTVIVEHMREADWQAWYKERKDDLAAWLSGQGKKDLATAIAAAGKKGVAALLKEENRKDAEANRKRKGDLKKLQQALSIVEEKERTIGLYNLPLFFKLHKASSLSSMLKLLKTIEFLYKIDLDTVIVHSGKDFDHWLRGYVAREKERNRITFEGAKHELQEAVRRAVDAAKAEIAHEREDLEGSLDILKREREKAIAERKAIEEEKADIQDIIDGKVSQATARAAQHEEILEKEYEIKRAQLKRDQEEVTRLRERQNIEIMADLQRNEKLKKAVEAERFLLEEDRNDFREERRRHEEEKRKDLDRKRSEVAKAKEEYIILTDKNKAEKKKLEAMQKDYSDKIQKEYMAKMKDVEKMRMQFEAYRDKENARLSKEGEMIRRERNDLKAMKGELSTQETKVTSLIAAHKEQVKKDMEDVRKIDLNLEQMETQLRKEREAIEKEGFEKYLASRLSDVHPAMPPVEAVARLDQDFSKVEHAKVYDMIDDCKALLSQQRIDEAMSIYNTIREAFAALGEGERSALYATIKELYADIHLASMQNTISPSSTGRVSPREG